MIIQPFALLMAIRYLQAFFPPQALHLLVIDLPTFHAQQGRDLAIAIPAILLGQSYQGESQFFTIPMESTIALRAARLTNDTTGAPFTGAQTLTGMNDSLADLVYAQAL